jgi:NAD(P)-dependent dehydrogenase (short-subunit alcohol dehydrogenase family)
MSSNGHKKVAIITGASQGIGAGLLERYLELGYAVVGTSRSIPSADDADLLTVRGDIAEPETATRVVRSALDRFGRIDTLINNAGVYIGKPFTEYTPEEYAVVKAVNLDGFFHITQRVLRQMLEQGSGGHIVNVGTSLTDNASSAAPSGLALLAKGGLTAVARSVAIEYADGEIRVNAIALGIIRTPMHDPATHDALAGFHPLGRMGEVSDVVDGVVFLEQASFVTGEVLHLDGGQSAGA